MPKNLQELLKDIFEQFQSSNLPIDDFIKQQLKIKGIQDVDKIVNDINRTLSAIDDKYESLQKARKEGYNREDWLREQIDDASKGFNTEDTGKVLSSAIKVISGNEDDTPDETANYAGMGAVDLVKQLDDVIVLNSCAALAKPEGDK